MHIDLRLKCPFYTAPTLSPNFVSIGVVMPVGTLNIIAYHGGLCRMEKGSEAGIRQGHRGCGGSMGVVGEGVS